MRMIGNLLKRLLMAWLILFVVSGIALFIFVQFFAEDFIKKYIEKDLAAKTNLNINISSAQFRVLPPFSVFIGGVRISTKDNLKNLAAESADFRLDLAATIKNLPSYYIKPQLVFIKPVITVQLPAPAAPTNAAQSGSQTVTKTSIIIPDNVDTHSIFEIQDGQLTVLRKSNVPNAPDEKLVFLNKLYTKFTVPSLRLPWKLDILTELNVTTPFKMALPIDLQSEFVLDMATMTMEVKQSSLRLAGIGTLISGKVDVDTLEQEWDIKLTAPDLSEIKNFALPGQWDGGVQASLKAKYYNELSVEGAIDLKDVAGDFSYQHETFQYAGLLKTTAQSTFTYDKKFDLKTATGSLDLTQADLKYKKLFVKPPGVPFSGQFDLGNDTAGISVKKLNLQLAHVNASGNGVFAFHPGQSSEIDLQIPRTNLGGLEKYFPMMQSPPTGFVQINATVKGDYQKPDTLLISANPVILDKVKLDTKWVSEDNTKSIQGEAAVDANAVFLLRGQDLVSSQLKADLDFVKMGMNIQDTFVKPAGQPFKIDIVANQKDKTIHVAKAFLFTGAGILDIKGHVSEPVNPKLNLSVQTPGLNLSKLAQIIPMLKKWKLSGTASAQLTMTGQYNFAKGIEGSPLYMTGAMSGNLPEFSYKTPPPPPGSPPVDPNAQALPSSMLPQWPIWQNAKLKTELRIGTLEYNELVMKGLFWSGNLDHGHLVGKADIKDIFDATVTIFKVKTNVVDPQPTIALSAVWGTLNTGKALDWFFPNWKGLVSGTGNGSIEVTLLHPSKKDYLQESVVHGRIKIVKAQLSTLKFDQMVNAKLASVPGISNNAPLTTGGVTGDILTDFDFMKSMLTIRPFVMTTPEKNEINITGWVKPDKSIDLKGFVHLSNAPVQGTIREANSDAKGRMLVPVHFTGNIFSPQLNIAEQTIKTILTKAAEYETRKATNQLRKKAETEVSKQVEQGKTRVKDELTKGIKGIFGK